MDSIRKVQQLGFGAMLLLQLGLLCFGKLYVGSLAPPLIFSFPLGYLAYRTMKKTGKTIPITRQLVLSAVFLSVLAIAGLIIPYRNSLRFWISLPIITDSAIVVSTMIAVAYIHSKTGIAPAAK